MVICTTETFNFKIYAYSVNIYFGFFITHSNYNNNLLSCDNKFKINSTPKIFIAVYYFS